MSMASKRSVAILARRGWRAPGPRPPRPSASPRCCDPRSPWVASASGRTSWPAGPARAALRSSLAVGGERQRGPAAAAAAEKEEVAILARRGWRAPAPDLTLIRAYKQLRSSLAVGGERQPPH